MRTLLAAALLVISLVLPLAAQDASPRVTVGAKQLDFLAGPMKDLVGRYHFDPAQAKPYFHPLNGPFGKPVTRGYPMIKDDPIEKKDHPHQRAVWFTYGDVIPEGIELKHRQKGVEGIDFWTEGAGHGHIRCAEVRGHKAEGHAAVVTRNEWTTGDAVKIMDETRTIRLHDLGQAKLFVFDIDLHASVAPITFGDTKEGAFGVRVAETITEQAKQGGVLENAEGKRTEKECWGQRSAWCDYSGPVDGKTVGVAILDDPKNPHPACWHSRGYGLMAANPFGRAKSSFPVMKGRTDVVRLAKGEHLKLRYGLLIHAGDAKEGRVAEHFQTFVRLK